MKQPEEQGKKEEKDKAKRNIEGLGGEGTGEKERTGGKERFVVGCLRRLGTCLCGYESTYPGSGCSLFGREVAEEAKKHVLANVGCCCSHRFRAEIRNRAWDEAFMDHKPLPQLQHQMAQDHMYLSSFRLQSNLIIWGLIL